MQVEPQPQTTPVTEDAPKPPLPSAPPEARDTGRTKRRPYVIGVLAIAALAALAALAAWVWGFSGRQVTPSLVVLPFVDMTTDQKDRALCNGITEELTVRLARLQNVHVVARTSSFAYQGKAEDIRAIGKSLGATHAIEGSVRRDGDALRVTVQLVSSMDGMQFYSQSFDFVTANQFDVQQTIAQAVTQEMRVWFSPEMIERWQADDSRSLRGFRFLRARASLWPQRHGRC